ncbi:MAG: helix-turn-helix domain-containing protein [Defluviitaleaceae bacterium]|nr:helix-turn-helix domain-containing protein [Defluviitaleaceae bacterium]
MLGQRISELRKSTKLSQADLGAELNFTQQAIAKWEKGVAEPNAENIVRLANFFGVTTDYLLGLSGDIANKTDLPSEKEQSEKLSGAEKALLRNFRNSDTEGKEAILGRALLVSSNQGLTDGLEDLEASSELTNLPMPSKT